MTELEQLIRTRLLRFGAHTQDPRWSSFLIDKFLADVISMRGDVSGILKELYSILGHSGRLSAELANLISDLAVLQFRTDVPIDGRNWLPNAIDSTCTPAQALLIWRSVPLESLAPSQARKIVDALDGTPYRSQAFLDLQEMTDGSDVTRPET